MGIQNELFEDYSNELLVFASVICILFIVVGVPGNILTIIALSRGKQTHNSTAVFIINLSLSDLLFGCFNLPLAASTFLQRSWSHGNLLCRLFPLLRYGLLAVSLFTVSLITINRYVIIAHPRHYPRIYQRKYLMMMVAGTWITAFSIMIPTWRGVWGKFGLDTSIGSCSILHDENDRSPKEFLFIIAFMVPCVCIVLCYTRIFYLVRKAALRTRDAPLIKNNLQPLSEPESPQQNVIATNKTNHLVSNANVVQSCSNENINMAIRPFFIDEDIDFIDVSDSNDDNPPITYNSKSNSDNRVDKISQTTTNLICDKGSNARLQGGKPSEASRSNIIKTSIKTSFTRFNSRKTHYISIGNTSNASSIYPGRMNQKDRRLLKMILVIFVSFVICYLPITLTKIWKSATNIHIFNISGYLLVYLTTCINPLIYVLMSTEYRQAYWNVVRCRSDEKR